MSSVVAPRPPSVLVPPILKSFELEGVEPDAAEGRARGGRARLPPEREADGLGAGGRVELDRVVPPVARPLRERRGGGQTPPLGRRPHLKKGGPAGDEFFGPGREAQTVTRPRLDYDQLRDRRGRRGGVAGEFDAEAARALPRAFGVEREVEGRVARREAPAEPLVVGSRLGLEAAVGDRPAARAPPARPDVV